jgi:UPF0716 protein FxsA
VPLLLVAALVVVPLVEIYVLIQVGQLLGALPTIALLLAMSVLGAVLLKREGARTWRAFREALGSGRVPATEVADGALVIFGGALLLTPGFVTDLFGLLCVLAPSRAVLRRMLTGLVTRRLGVAGTLGLFGAGPLGRRGAAPGRPAAPPPGSRGRGVVDGEVVDDPPPSDPPPGPPRG